MREPLQQKLQALADEAHDPLDPSTRERIITQVRADGPGTVRSARRRRTAIRVGGPLIVTAGLAALLMRPAPTNPAPRCAAWIAVEGAPLAGAMTLGKRGSLDAAPDTRGRIEGSLACRTIVVLVQGSVTVRADDLGGGTLTVRTSRGDVDVHGTIFSVNSLLETVTIDVREGRVSWTAPGAEAVFIDADESLTIEAPTTAQITTAEAVDEAEEVADVDEPEEVAKVEDINSPPRTRRRKRARAEPRMTADALVLRAEALRRGSNVAGARAAYRAAGALEGPTAEAAWIALARYELELGQPRRSLAALKQRARRFASGSLTPEAEWIAVQAFEAAGEAQSAEQRAAQLIRRWPSSPQAKAARRWVEASK